MSWLTNQRRLALSPAETTVRVSIHRESPARYEQDLNLPAQNLSSGLVEQSCAVAITTIRIPLLGSIITSKHCTPSITTAPLVRIISKYE